MIRFKTDVFLKDFILPQEEMFSWRRNKMQESNEKTEKLNKKLLYQKAVYGKTSLQEVK